VLAPHRIIRNIFEYLALRLQQPNVRLIYSFRPDVARFWVLILFFPVQLRAQEPRDSSYLEVSTVQSVQSLSKTALFISKKRNSLPDADITGLNFTEQIPVNFRVNIPVEIAGNTIYLRFPLANGSDTVQELYFYPGLYCKNIQLFKISSQDGSQSLVPVRNPPPDNQLDEGVALVRLQPKEKSVFFAKLDFILTVWSSLSPNIVKKDFLPYFKNNLTSNKITINLLNYLTAGILLMMIFYSIAVYLQNYSVEFLYYSAYAGCMAILLFLKSYLFGTANDLSYFFEGYLDFMVQMTGYSFYLLFFRKFLNTKLEHPFLEKVLGFSNWVVLASLILFSILNFASSGYAVINLVENITKQYLLLVSIVFIFYGFRRKDPLMNYLVVGQLALTTFSVISFLLIITPIKLSKTPHSVFNDSLLYYQAGLVLELIFFLAGLSFKNRRDLIERIKERERLKLENERKEFEKQVAILEAKQQERNRISADMHDELGSGVTAIRLMSEIVKTKMKEDTLPEIEKISNSANELLNKMNTIIWTMVSSNDSVESLVAYIRAYAVEFFENTPIECRFQLPSYIPPYDLSGEKRRNIFLAIKEALNNVLKHSHASLVTIEIRVSEKLTIEVYDDGVGVDLDNLRRFGNGLQNMKKRIASISGEFRIENHQGTRTIFEVDL
jgi:signal transduction histidine kinase